MTQDNVVRPTAWRGTAAADTTVRPEIVQDVGEGSRVLLLIENRGNNRRLAAELGHFCTVLEPTDLALPAEGFDLAVVDGPGFRRWRTLLAQAKVNEQPTFLPVMLVLPRQDLRRRAGAYWDLVDEFIVAPIDRTEFIERAALLLRTRRMAKEQQAELAHIVNHDSTTGLPSQTLFMDRVQTAVHNASILNQSVHVVVVHVPLARVMKSLGHHALERTVQICANRLRKIIGDKTSLARLTTEDWGLLPPTGTTIDELTHMCRQLGQLGGEPIEVADERIHLSAYMGIGTYPDNANSAAETLNVAFGALSRAQKPGEPYFYSRDVQTQALRYLRTEAKLREALERQQFELWFQPQFRLADRAIIGAEALVRWRLPTGELVSPGDFIPVAESSGLIPHIDRWVIEAACKTIARWRREKTLDLRIAVNITPSDISDPDFVPWIKGLFQQYQVLPPWLELELTETMLCDTDSTVLEKLNDLRDYGVTVAIDDFGTGYSSLGYLHQLPINVLKIDKSFTDRVPGDETSEGITEAIIGLAQHFGLELVAEGIETEEQLEYLGRLNVDTGQGFLIGRPMPEPNFLTFIGHS